MQPSLDFASLISELARHVAKQVREEFEHNPLAVRPRLLTVEQAATYMGRTEEAMQHMIGCGKVPTVRIDRRVFVDIRDLERLIDGNKIAAR